MKKSLLTGAFALCLSLGAAVSANAQVVVRIGPPPPVREVQPPRPHPGWEWQPGYHRWDGAHYVWVGGTWVAPPRPGVHWVPGHWRNTPRGYVWVDGHWR
jgi:hypothetical protein